MIFLFFFNNKITLDDLINALTFLKKCEKPKFPISGEMLKMHGYESGKELGKTLKKIEDQWISNNFNIDQKTIKKFLNNYN